MNIRPYEVRDREDIRRVCRETCSDEYLLSHDNVLCTKYADYYTDEEAAHIFVLADDADRAQGYILCCTDASRFVKKWRGEYLKRIRESKLYVLMTLHTMWEVSMMARKGYKAHLHIDISPAFQRAGGGHRLVAALIEHLKAEGVGGVYLGCGKENAIGNAFYQKCGFELMTKGIFRNIYTMKTR